MFSSDEPLEIKRIFAASRGVEEAVYAHEVGNDWLLFHASRPANFLGILSRWELPVSTNMFCRAKETHCPELVENVIGTGVGDWLMN